MPSIKEKLALEEQNSRTIRLWSEGMFFKVYERSAYLFVKHVHHYEARMEFYKGIGRDAVHVGFPQSVLATLGVEHSPATDGSEVIRLDTALEEQQFLLWRDAVRPVVAAPEPAAALAAEPPPVLPPPVTALEKTIMERLRSFSLASATPMDAMLFLNELQQMIRKED